jgi:hypothetical protein
MLWIFSPEKWVGLHLKNFIQMLCKKLESVS